MPICQKRGKAFKTMSFIHQVSTSGTSLTIKYTVETAYSSAQYL